MFLFGINIIILKALSLVFMLGFIWFFYKSFKNNISPFILSCSLILLSINHLLLYYSSQTYSEAFFLFLQALFFYTFFKFFIEKETTENKIENFKRHAFLAVCILMLGLTRNIGNLAFGVVLFYFILHRQWKNLLYITIAFAIVFVLFQAIKYILWGDTGLQFAAQGSGLMNKNYYDPTAGTENFSGFITRFLANSNLYISSSFMAMLGFSSDIPLENGVPVITIIYYILIITGIFLVSKKNKFLLFTGIYTFVFLVTTFVILQTIWFQLRIIVPFFPLMLIFLLSTIYFLLKINRFKKFQIFTLLFVIIILVTSSVKTKDHYNEMSHSGDIYDGLTPDWVNYIKASKWSAENIPKEINIACRKPTISFIYGNGRHFFGIDRVPTYPLAPLMNNWLRNNNKYIAINSVNLSRESLVFYSKSKLNENIKAFVTQEKKLFFIFEEPKDNKERFYNELNTFTDKQIHDAVIFNKMFIQKADVLYPDSLVQQLCKNKIKYILAASIRANIEQKNKIVNTINRYMIVIRFRYPKLFTDEMKFGDEEPTTLIKVHYENYNFSFCN